ncbi:MAG: hypothetical protein J6C13_03070, partial [Clostridia bacterium]|nr:hypothetical protein [Clostridia bacterium]
MKLFGKTTFLAFSAMMATSFGFLSPVMVGGSLSGATSSTGPVITLTGYDPVFDIDDASTFDTAAATGLSGFKLPVATGASMPTAKDMAGKSATVVHGADGYYYLVTTKSGKYEITYSSDSTGAVTSTRNIIVEIKKGSATLNFDSNSAQIIPTIAYVGEKITFPKVKVMNGEEEDTTASATVNSSITLTDIQGNVKTLTEENGYKTYTIASGDTGDFEVTYKYSQPGNTISQKFVFRVAQNEQEVSLKYSAFSNSLESFDLEVGVEAELPKPTVVNSSANDAEVKDVFTKITVTDLSKT